MRFAKQPIFRPRSADRTRPVPGLRWIVIGGTMAAMIGLSSPAAALISSNLNGYLRVTGVSSEVDSQTTRSLSQEYSLHWTKRMAAFVEMRASMRYLNLGVDQSLGANSWRREYQPAGELLWTHPDFQVAGMLSRRRSTNLTTGGDLVDENATISFSTRMVRYPFLRMRYEWDRAYNDGGTFGRDTRQNSGNISLSYNFHRQSLYYDFGRQINTDAGGGIRITDTNHRFRWSQTTMMPGRFLRISSTYDFSRRGQETETSNDSTVLSPIPYRLALYAYDPTPEFGLLDTLPDLADGNTDTPARPLIDIGAGLADRNIGLDFGYDVNVAALYIYTDRPSGPLVAWRVYLSSDNLTWTALDEPVSTAFNAGFERYEIIFPAVRARYIKAVNSGANDEPTVLVTELEARERLPKASRENRHQTSHLVNAVGTVFLARHWESSAEINFRGEPKGEFTDSRTQLYYAFSLRHTPTAIITQTLRYQAGYEDYAVGDVRNDNTSLIYSAAVRPLTALHFSFAAFNRVNYIASVKTQETNNVMLKTSGNLLAGLTLTGETTYSRNNRYNSRRVFDTWTHRLGGSGTLVRPLDFTAYFLYQGTDQRDTSFSLIRRQYSVDFTLRLSHTISGHGSLTFDDDGRRKYTYQTYGISWAATPKLLFGGQTTMTSGTSDVTGDRSSAQVTYQISSRGSLYGSIAEVQYPSAGRARGVSLQLGLKASL